MPAIDFGTLDCLSKKPCAPRYLFSWIGFSSCRFYPRVALVEILRFVRSGAKSLLLAGGKRSNNWLSTRSRWRRRGIKWSWHTVAARSKWLNLTLARLPVGQRRGGPRAKSRVYNATLPDSDVRFAKPVLGSLAISSNCGDVLSSTPGMPSTTVWRNYFKTDVWLRKCYAIL